MGYREDFDRLLADALDDNLIAAALVDCAGNAVGVAGAITGDEAMPLAALVIHRMKSEGLAQRLFSRELLSLDLEERGVVLGIAKRQLYVVGIVRTATDEVRDRVGELLEAVEVRLRAAGTDATPWRPIGGGGGTGGAGPAELPVIELGVTVRRPRGEPN